MKLLLAAIAKNEALYLPEWIYHYQSIGVDEIWIYVNNTNDNSRDVIMSMRKKGINVRVIEADEIIGSNSNIDTQNSEPDFLKRNPLQSRAFSNIYNNAIKEGFDYVALFDVDEFLYTKGQSIKSLITHANNPEILRFNWFGQFFDETPFEITFKQRLIGERSMTFKNIISTNDPLLKFVSTHHVKFSNRQASAWFPSVGNVSWQKPAKDIPWSKDFFVVHRAFRSKHEFLSRISGGANIKAREVDGFKLNRFTNSLEPAKPEEIILDNNYAKNYANGYQDFIKKCDLIDILSQEQNNLDVRVNEIKNRIKTLPKRVKVFMEGVKKFDLI